MWLLCQRSARQRGREKRWIVAPHRCVGRTGGGRRGRLLMGALLPATPAVTIQTLPKIKIEKDGAREYIICVTIWRLHIAWAESASSFRIVELRSCCSDQVGFCGRNEFKLAL